MARSPARAASLLLPLLVLSSSAEGSQVGCSGGAFSPEEQRTFATLVMQSLSEVLMLHANVTADVLIADIPDGAGWNSSEGMALFQLVQVIDVLPSIMTGTWQTMASVSDPAWMANVSGDALEWLTNVTNRLDGALLLSLPPMVSAAMDQLKQLDPDAYQEAMAAWSSFNSTTPMDTLLWGMDRLRDILSRIAWCTRARSGCATVVPLTCVADSADVLLNLDLVIADLLESAQADCESENASMTSCMGDVALALKHLSKVSENIAKGSQDCLREDQTYIRMIAGSFSWFASTTKSAIDVAVYCNQPPGTDPQPPLSMCDLSTLDVVKGAFHVANSIDALLQLCHEDAIDAPNGGELRESMVRLVALLQSRHCTDAALSTSVEPPSTTLRRLRGLP